MGGLAAWEDTGENLLFRPISKKRRPLANLCEATGHHLGQNSSHETYRNDRSPLGLAL